PDVSEKEITKVVEVLRSGWWTTGPVVTEFENKAIEYLRDSEDLYAVGVNSCTSGLYLALIASGIVPQDEVIIPTWTFAATAQVVEWIGAIPVLCDIEEDSLNIDLSKAEKLITSRTKAIIPVHMAGYPCDLDGLRNLARKYNLKVIEDAAHAFGTKYYQRKIGNFSDLCVFSFYATKTLATGEGGMVVSRDKQLIEKIRQKSYFGINKEAFKRYGATGAWFYDIEELGYKCNFDSIHAALGLAQLERLDQMVAIRRQIAKRYRDGLSGLVDFTADSDRHFHPYHLFIIKLKSPAITRNDLIIELKKRNIGSSVHFIPLHMHSYYKKRFPENNFPVANKTFSNVLSIPMFSAMTIEDADYVIDQLKIILGG
ncbi:MAG: DegT/DnrJ/EryC1/StrS family aminotransferase, partial [bacterium]|nr:DegT/DnrJ/EryC1/StrS family aminotransferase [bacterium]